MVENVRSKNGRGACKALAVWYLPHGRQAPARRCLTPTGAINPQVIGLDTSKWDEEGLFPEDGSGMTLADALELIPGIGEFDLEARGARLVEEVPATT